MQDQGVSDTRTASSNDPNKKDMENKLRRRDRNDRIRDGDTH